MNLNLQFDIPDVATRLTEGYVLLKIQRDSGGGFVEISGPTIRPPLRAGVSKYVYQDPAGDDAWDYRAVPIMADGTEYGTTYTSSSVTENTYVTLQDVRDEGVPVAEVSDTRVLEFIEKANQYVEDYTQNWFTPQYRILQVTGEDRQRLFLSAPIIAVQKVTIDGQVEDVSNLVVNNRYLRNGLASPDDRKNPMITYSEGYLVEEGIRLETLGGGAFPAYRQEVKIWGVFGFTELPRGAVAGETETGSQVPIEYGGIPELIKWAAVQIVVNRCYPILSDQSIAIMMKDRITSLKTRDQSVQFSEGNSGNSTSTKGFTNNAAVDNVLDKFKRPIEMRFV